VVTAAEFEEAYARRSGTTVAELHRLGRWAEPCDCGDDGCEGWIMGHQHEDALYEDQDRAAALPQITVRKYSYWAEFPLDTDGTPLHHGERMVEIRPGQWVPALDAAVMAYLADACDPARLTPMEQVHTDAELAAATRRIHRKRLAGTIRYQAARPLMRLLCLPRRHAHWARDTMLTAMASGRSKRCRWCNRLVVKRPFR
jgi:hypothetical protein